ARMTTHLAPDLTLPLRRAESRRRRNPHRHRTGGETMKLGALFTVNAVIAAIFGIALVIAPAPLLEAYAVTVNSGSALVARLLGAALVAFAVVSWVSRTAAQSEARRAITLGFFVGDLIGTFVALQGVLTGATNGLGWSTVVLYALLA